jgi:PAS domain S-box-containing protein
MQRDRLRLLLQRCRSAAFALTARAEIWEWNAESEALLGYSATEAVGKPFVQLVRPRDPLGKPIDSEYCERAIRDGGVPSFDMRVRARDGTRYWLNVTVLVFEQFHSSQALVVHIAHDITASRHHRAVFGRLIEAAREIIELADDEHHLVPVSPLTEQEQRVLRAFESGQTPAQVLRALHISAQTLRNHLHHINQKLGTHNRLEAVMHAVRRRLI